MGNMNDLTKNLADLGSVSPEERKWVYKMLIDYEECHLSPENFCQILKEMKNIMCTLSNFFKKFETHGITIRLFTEFKKLIDKEIEKISDKL